MTDPNAGDTHTLVLGDDASGLFALDGNTLVLAPGATLDFEQASSHKITVRATDENGLSFDQAFLISVNNRPDPLIGDDGANDLTTGAGGDPVTLGGGADTLNGFSRISLEIRSRIFRPRTPWCFLAIKSPAATLP